MLYWVCDVRNINLPLYTVWPDILMRNLFWRIGGFESNPIIFHLPILVNAKHCESEEAPFFQSAHTRMLCMWFIACIHCSRACLCLSGSAASLSPAGLYVTAAGGPVSQLVLSRSLPTRRLSSLYCTVSEAHLSLSRSHLLRRHSSLSVGFITVQEVTNAEDQSI